MQPPLSDKPRFIDNFKLFDFFSKTNEQVPTQRTSFGGVFTVFTVLLLLFLVFSEIYNYKSVVTEDVLTVDTRRGEKLPIHMDILFHNLLCKEVAVDAVDGTTGETIEEASHQIIKKRMLNNVAIGTSKQEDLGQLDNAKSKGSECMSCTLGIPPHLMHQARNPPECCNTCIELRHFFINNLIPQRFADATPQCKVDAVPYSDEEGCQVYGYIQVPRARGDFHIAAGKGFGQSHESHSHHMHAIDWDRIDKFNISHQINSLSFGPPIPGIVNPLDGKVFISKGLAQHSYYIQVVPTIYRQGEEAIRTNQYSFTQHHHRIDRTQSSFALPGLYFRFDISPLMIQISEKEKPLADFVTNMCAIIGGIYVAFGIVYSLSSTVVSKTTTKKKN